MQALFRGRTSLVLAFIAGLAVASVGSATAARLITGKQIQNGSVGLKDLTERVRARLASEPGPKGDQGARGEQGPKGDRGDPGEFAPASIGTALLADSAVTAAKLADGSVDGGALLPGIVSSSHLLGGAVGSREVADGSLQAEDFVPGTVAPRLFAHVSSNGTLAENAGVERATRVATGRYHVVFVRELRGCVPVAGIGFGFGPGVIGAGRTAQARLNADNDPRKVQIDVYKGTTFADVEDNDVNVIVMC